MPITEASVGTALCNDVAVSIASGRPIVFVDANAIVKQAWFLDTPQWRLLRHQSQHGAIELVVPEVAFREVVAKFRLEVSEELKTLTGVQEKLHRLIEYEIPETSTAEVDFLVENYREELQAILDRCNAVVVPIPEVDLAELVERAANRHRPFDSSGNGFRDALIWETVVAQLNAKRPTAAFLVTNDNAFYSSNNDVNLHSELISDAESRGSSSSIQPWRFLGPYLTDAFGTKDHALLSRITSIIEESHGSLSNGLDSQLIGLVDGLRFRDGASIEITACDGSHLRLATAATTEDGPVLVNLVYTTEVTIRMYSTEPNSREFSELTMSLEIPATTLMGVGADYFEPLVLESVVELVLRKISRAYPQPILNTQWQSAIQGLKFPLIDEQILNNVRGLRLPIERSAPFWPEVLKGIDVASVLPNWTEMLKGIDIPSVMPNWTEMLKGIDFHPMTLKAPDEDTNSEEDPDGSDDEIDPSP